jgi:hypothetical protein
MMMKVMMMMIIKRGKEGNKDSFNIVTSLGWRGGGS